MQKSQQALGHGHGVVLGGAAVASPGSQSVPPRARGSVASPAAPNSEIDPSVSSAAASSSGLPFGSMPAWPQTHPLLQHQGQAAVDGQLQSHLYLQHALHLAQRAIQQQQQQGNKVAPNNMKLQEFMQLQSAMAAAQSDRDRALQQLSRNDAGSKPPQQTSQTSPPGNNQSPQQQQQQQQRVPSSMAFLFGQNPQALVGSSPAQSRPMDANTRPSSQQFMSPEMLQARVLAMQQQQQQPPKTSTESPHLRLGTAQMMSPGSSSEQEPPPTSSNIAGFPHGSDLLPSLRGGFSPSAPPPSQQQQQQQFSSNLGNGLMKPEMNSNSSAPGFPIHPRQQHQVNPRAILENQVPAARQQSQQQSAAPTTTSDSSASQHAQPAVKSVGFTIQQLMVLRAQILAFRRLKRGDRSFTTEMIRAITPVPLPPPPQKQAAVPSETNQPKVSLETADEEMHRDSPAKPQDAGPEADPGLKATAMQQGSSQGEGTRSIQEVAVPSRPVNEKEKLPESNENAGTDRTTARLPGKTQPSKRYRGPLFDFPPLGKQADASLLSAPNVWGPPATLKYDVRELLLQEGLRIISNKKAKKMKIIEMLLSDGSLNVPSELKLKLRIEQRKLVLLRMQGKVRKEIEEQQQEIMAMGDRAYRKFVRLCERQRMEISRQVMVLQKTSKEKYLKGLFQWRKKLFEAHWSSRDCRINRNRGIAKFHEKLLREYSKRKDEDRSKRMEALKNNDVDAYREMLKKQQKEIPGDAEQRFQVLESFLSQTEDYLHKLGGKISSVKNQQEREEAALAAAASARAQGFLEEDVERAAAQASEAVALRSWNGATAHSVNKYYSLAHAVNEQILRQPSMLRAGVLRDYQLVGLQWMLSLYNNRLNGILADEMGLGKTVQVMALIAYLMEFKGNYGPHLIIVPNAVMVNWKSELGRWLPSVSCIFYVGVREDRSRIYSQEVAALKFNVLVTTYEFIMRDRSKLAKIDWKYIIIDEAQRMKDRESRLARDLDRFRCQRRLLLTGTPLQNDLHELWSLLNLLLPEVFDNSKAFHDWFSKPFTRDANTVEDDWLETEKKVIVIHRLHQILEPFMLRRRVEDVEGSLPPKVPVVLKCKMSAYQAAIYDWVKATGTLRLDPADEEERVASGNGKRQVRAYAPLQNKCMELRKVCNHPYLNYPPQCRLFNENMVRMCGKLWILDRILIKLQRSGHRVLLFSTMTKLLDILEDYLQWRGLIYRRIDGTTPLDSRESAIVDFNAAGSQCFIFLLSIRAAGRGLNLQTADTVVIYDPDPNPKNEEQAVARAHRIGQKSEVKVIYMEAVVETFTSYQMEDELRNGGSLDVDDEMAGKDKFVGSVESLVRNNIQQHKIDMADEVINAGRFDQRTTHEERRITLEALLHDEERYQESVHDVPMLKEVNRMVARSEEEVELFDQMDEECEWPGEMLAYDEVPDWLHVGSDEVNAAIKATSKQALVRGCSGTSGIIGTKAEEDRVLAKKASSRKNFNVIHDRKPLKPARRGRPPLVPPTEVEDDEDLEEAVIEEDSSSGEDEEEGEIRDGSDEEEEDTGQQQQDDADEMDDEGEAVAESSDEREGSPETRVAVQLADSKKFGSLAELGSRSNQDLDGEDLEEGEIAASGESPGESPSDKEQDEDHVVEPQRKRKRSARHRRKVGGITGNVPVQGVFPVGFLQPWSGYSDYERPEVWNITPRPAAQYIHSGFANWSSQTASKQNRVNGFQELAEEVAVAELRECRTTRAGARMQENVQKKCKAVLSKLQGAMNKDGRQVSALLMELPKRHELPDYYKVIDKPIDAKTIEEHLERFDYATVLDFAGDVQLMLDNASRYNTHNAEVQADARRLHSLFFQRMGLMFPDVDFNSIKVSIGIRLSGSRSSRKQRQVFAEAGKLTPPQEKDDLEGAGTRGSRETSSSSRRRTKPGVPETGIIHPADLVICKRKRNSRRKPRIKVPSKRKRGSSVEQSSTTKRDSNTTNVKGGVKSMVDDGGPLSWARARKVFSGGLASASSPSSSSLGTNNNNRDSGNDGTIHHPRKKSRTDIARRRPSTRL